MRALQLVRPEMETVCGRCAHGLKRGAHGWDCPKRGRLMSRDRALDVCAEALTMALGGTVEPGTPRRDFVRALQRVESDRRAAGLKPISGPNRPSPRSR